MKKELVPVDKIYKLKTGKPLSYTLPSRNTQQFPLMHYDEEKNVTRALRYATNQKSCFEDEQDGNALLAPIIFEDGFLHVPKENPVLQKFLSDYHPLRDRVYEEVDYSKDAATEVEKINVEIDAAIAAKELTLDEMEMVYRVLFSKDPTMISNAEMKRDILVYARNSPKQFLNVIQDPSVRHRADVHIFFDKKLLQFRNANKEVWFNTSSNKKRMLNVPHGQDPYAIVEDYLKTDEGIEALKALKIEAQN